MINIYTSKQKFVSIFRYLAIRFFFLNLSRFISVTYTYTHARVRAHARTNTKEKEREKGKERNVYINL